MICARFCLFWIITCSEKTRPPWQVKLQLAETQRRILRAQMQTPPQKVALVMDGKVLAILLEKKHRRKLLALGIQCCAVICCRVSPLQKSQITK